MRHAFHCPVAKKDEYVADEDLRIAVPVYRTERRVGPVVLSAGLPAAGAASDDTWVLLGVSILLDPYVHT